MLKGWAYVPASFLYLKLNLARCSLPSFKRAGRRDEALKILADQKRLAKERYVSPYNVAIIYTGLGDKDRAFEWLTKCVEERTRILSFHFKSRPLFDSLRSDPRYVEILRRMNLKP